MTDYSVRALMAQFLLDQHASTQTIQLGSVALRPHQVSAARRVESAIDEFGGALLCDQVGMGKTFVALAVARKRVNAAVVAPAILRDMWNAAARSADSAICFISTESLSRRTSRVPDTHSAGESTGFLIVDEAHHFRNPATQRFAAIARLASRRQVLLLTATPVHNRIKDLAALLSLFLGSRSADLTSAEFSRIVVARNRAHLQTAIGIPAMAPPRWCTVSHDDDIAEMLLALPPPVPPRDGGDGGVLIVHSLIRQWASSDAALRQALVRRLLRATAITDAMENGSYPSIAELSAWTAADDCVQLAFTELVAPRISFDEKLLSSVRRHTEWVRRIKGRLGDSNERDRKRAAVIREIRGRHRGAGIVAFSQYADTVDELFRLLAPDGRVAALTGNSARVFGGRISRSEAIGRFAPVANGRARPAGSEEVTLLLTTDLLSEGVNLQDAAVVVHLDLPWTPARMEQRLGRVARMGSPHERVFSYIMRPPATAETTVRLERILCEKMEAAGLVADGLENLLPSPRDVTRARSAAAVTEEIRSILQSWSGMERSEAAPRATSSAILAPVDGFVALCCFGDTYELLVEDERGLTNDPARVLASMRNCTGGECPSYPAETDHATAVLVRYFTVTSALDSTHASRNHAPAYRRDALRRIAQITALARPHERSRLSSLAARAKTSILGRMGAEDEWALAKLAALELSDFDWLQRVIELRVNATSHARDRDIIAVIVLRKRAT